MSRIKEVEDQIPNHLSKYIQNKMRKHLLKEYYARAGTCCGYAMSERKDFDGKPIYWCSSCGKKDSRSDKTGEKDD